jgi:hypothetical protein
VSAQPHTKNQKAIQDKSSKKAKDKKQPTAENKDTTNFVPRPPKAKPKDKPCPENDRVLTNGKSKPPKNPVTSVTQPYPAHPIRHTQAPSILNWPAYPPHAPPIRHMSAHQCDEMRRNTRQQINTQHTIENEQGNNALLAHTYKVGTGYD